MVYVCTLLGFIKKLVRTAAYLVKEFLVVAEPEEAITSRVNKNPAPTNFTKVNNKIT